MSCTHTTIVKYFRPAKRNSQFPYELMKEMVVRCMNCEEENNIFLNIAKEVIDLTEKQKQ